MALKLVIALSFALNILLTAQEGSSSPVRDQQNTSGAVQAKTNDTAPEQSGPPQKKAGAALTGTVLRSDTKAPINNARVTLVASGAEQQDIETGPPAQTVTTDEKGRFEFANLEAGNYNVSAEHAGMVIKKRQRSENMLVSVKPGEQQEISLLMQPSCAISGRVLDEQGEPLQNASISALRYGYSIAGRRTIDSARATTNDKGEYRLFGLAPGAYLVLVDVNGATGAWFFRMAGPAGRGAQRDKKKEERVYTPTYYPNESSPEQASPLVLKPGDEAEANFSLVRVPAHHISGKVTGFPASGEEDKTKVQRMVMVVRQGSQIPVSMALVNPDSSFDVGPLPAGKYKLVAMQIKEESQISGRTDVTLGTSDVTGINIAVNAATRHIAGVVHTDSDAKVDYSKLYVVLLPETLEDLAAGTGGDFSLGNGLSSSAGMDQVKKDGSFQMELVPSGEVYRVALSAIGGGLEDWFASKVVVGGHDVMDTGLRMTQATGPIEIVISRNGAAVEGIALDADKKPFANAEVVAVPADPRLRKRFDLMQKAEADQQGRFKLRGVRPGEYTVMALEDPEEQPFLEDEFLKQHSGEMQKLMLEAGKSQRIELNTIAVE